MFVRIFKEGFYSIPTFHSTRLSLSIRFGLTWHRFFHAQCRSQSTACSKLSGTLIRSRKNASSLQEILKFFGTRFIHHQPLEPPQISILFFYCPYTTPISHLYYPYIAPISVKKSAKQCMRAISEGACTAELLSGPSHTV